MSFIRSLKILITNFVIIVIIFVVRLYGATVTTPLTSSFKNIHFVTD